MTNKTSFKVLRTGRSYIYKISVSPCISFQMPRVICNFAQEHNKQLVGCNVAQEKVTGSLLSELLGVETPKKMLGPSFKTPKTPV